MNAIVFVNCLLGTKDAADRQAARKQSTEFQKFMDSLSWSHFEKKVEEKSKPKTAENVLKQLFGGIGLIPVRKKEKKQGEN